MPVGGLVPKVAEAQIAERGQKTGQDKREGESSKGEKQREQNYHYHQVSEVCTVSPFLVKSVKE